MTVEDVIAVERDVLHISLTCEDVSRLARLLPPNDPLLDLVEVEMREQGFWIEPVVA